WCPLLCLVPAFSAGAYTILFLDGCRRRNPTYTLRLAPRQARIFGCGESRRGFAPVAAPSWAPQAKDSRVALSENGVSTSPPTAADPIRAASCFNSDCGAGISYDSSSAHPGVPTGHEEVKLKDTAAAAHPFDWRNPPAPSSTMPQRTEPTSGQTTL